MYPQNQSMIIVFYTYRAHGILLSQHVSIAQPGLVKLLTGNKLQLLCAGIFKPGADSNNSAEDI